MNYQVYVLISSAARVVLDTESNIKLSGNEQKCTILEDLRAQRELGVEISIDDFGTGYSSLSYLKHFPVTHLKIDRSFLEGAPENDYDGALMEAIVNVGHKLNLKIVVEGVETESQSDYCKSLNVEFVQGYLYSRPVSADAIESLYLEQSR